MMSTRTSRRTRSSLAHGGIPINSPDAPEENSDAGSSADLHKRYIESQVRSYRGRANRNFARAQRLIGHRRQASEREARQAIESVVNAFWWAEDTEMEDGQHALMHKIGRWTRRSFGCHLLVNDEGYHRTCPIDIAHIRAGFSIGFVADRICSLCGDDLSECSHLPGRSYWVRGGPQVISRCRVCGMESCNHRADRLYRAPVISIVKEGELREVSLVPRPANPEARITRIAVTREDLREALGSSFWPGMRVTCDKCLGECPGFSSMEDVDQDGVVSRQRTDTAAD